MVLEIFEGILNALSQNGIWSIVDILVVALIVYGGLSRDQRCLGAIRIWTVADRGPRR